jgi:vacuolar-type H+-ATPase subunit I/STV1
MKTFHIPESAYFTDLSTEFGNKISDMTDKYFENKSTPRAKLKIGGRFLKEMEEQYEKERQRAEYRNLILPKDFKEAITPYGELELIKVTEEIMEIVE